VSFASAWIPNRCCVCFVAAALAAALPFPGLPSQFEKIAPAANGRVGVASRLLDELISSASSGGVRDVFLGTTEKFVAAHRFYEKNGFVQIPAAGLPAAFPRMSLDTRFYHRVLN
jgi:L-amino acid N-acyltransferase YncA